MAYSYDGELIRYLKALTAESKVLRHSSFCQQLKPMFSVGFKGSTEQQQNVVHLCSEINLSLCIRAINSARKNGKFGSLCITSEDDPEDYNWGVLHSLDLNIVADEDIPHEKVTALMTEIARWGAYYICAYRPCGKLIRYFIREGLEMPT